MINVKEAQEQILNNACLSEAEEVALNNAHGRVLAEDIQAPVSHPLFDQSAMDGYALRFNDLMNDSGAEGVLLTITGEIQAGDHPNIKLKEGEAIRIFTGAPIPEGTDTVIMQEHVELTCPASADRQETGRQNGSSIQINLDLLRLKKGANIRRQGEQILKGAIALSKGTMLNPAGIGFLASLGIGMVSVFRLPEIGIVVTGNEFTSLIREPDNIEIGKIYESNGIMLQSALRKMGINTNHQTGEDNPKKLKTLLQKVTDLNDITIITGGVSVGRYDFTKATLEDIGFKIVFHKVSQKPGKPILFAKKGNKVAFGLPGNPRAVLICFYEYVYPFIRNIMGHTDPFLPTIQLPLAQDYEKKDDKKGHFLAVKLNGNEIKLLEIQGSHMLQSLSGADGLMILPENKTTFLKGELVDVHLLPQA